MFWECNKAVILLRSFYCLICIFQTVPVRWILLPSLCKVSNMYRYGFFILLLRSIFLGGFFYGFILVFPGMLDFTGLPWSPYRY